MQNKTNKALLITTWVGTLIFFLIFGLTSTQAWVSWLFIILIIVITAILITMLVRYIRNDFFETPFVVVGVGTIIYVGLINIDIGILVTDYGTSWLNIPRIVFNILFALFAIFCVIRFIQEKSD